MAAHKKNHLNKDTSGEHDPLVAQRDMGIQPIDHYMNQLGLSNTDLVKASTEQLSHKMVTKARKGRRISANVKWKIFRALKKCIPEEPCQLKDLFNY